MSKRIVISQPSPVLTLPRHELAASRRRKPFRTPPPPPKPPVPKGRKTYDTCWDEPYGPKFSQ